jgi:sulfoxide reductase heme-binding subunit YedZ
VNSTLFWYVTRASGIVALVLLTSTMVLGLTTTTRARTRHWPGFARQELHRRVAMLSMVFLAIHVLTSILDTYVDIGWASVLVPFTSSYSRFWVGMGTVAVDLMVAVFVSSLLRARMKPGTWRGLHWLAYGCWPVALAHTFGMGTDAGEPWVITLGASCVLAVGVALFGRLRATARRSAARAAGHTTTDTETASVSQSVLVSSARGAGHAH